MSNYLIELSIIHTVLILGYWFVLRKEQQYSKIRFYLLVSTLLALFVPLLKLPKLFTTGSHQLEAIIIEAVPSDSFRVVETGSAYSFYANLIFLIYAGISLFLLIKLLGSIIYLIRLERKSTREQYDELYVRKAPKIEGSFSFFNWIFLSSEISKEHKDYQMILKHEKAHASLGHTYDLLFFELFKVCFWWLPTSWLIIKEARKIHEYQADTHALRTSDIDQYSSTLINSTLKLNGLSLVSSFHNGLILKRLIEMKKQTKNVSPWKLGTLTALCTALVLAFACSEESNEENLTDSSGIVRETFSIVEESPEFEGGKEAFYRYLTSEIKYPLQARKLGIEGKVNVEFVVERDGSISNVKVNKGIGAGCDGEAIRVLENAPSFKPGKQRGKTVRVKMQIPIIFKLNDGKLNDDNSTQGMVILEEVLTKNAAFKVDAGYNNGEWSGTVLDEEGNRLPGVNIVVAGTNFGTVSDLDGTFNIKADKEKDLHLSFVGYETVKLRNY
ncbi:MAG: TonB family protein [Bacteroidota bacterium]